MREDCVVPPTDRLDEHRRNDPDLVRLRRSSHRRRPEICFTGDRLPVLDAFDDRFPGDPWQRIGIFLESYEPMSRRSQRRSPLGCIGSDLDRPDEICKPVCSGHDARVHPSLEVLEIFLSVPSPDHVQDREPDLVDCVGEGSVCVRCVLNPLTAESAVRQVLADHSGSPFRSGDIDTGCSIQYDRRAHLDETELGEKGIDRGTELPRTERDIVHRIGRSNVDTGGIVVIGDCQLLVDVASVEACCRATRTEDPRYETKQYCRDEYRREGKRAHEL